MRPVIITQNITVDGSIEMLDDWYDPSDMPESGELAELNREQDAACDLMLLGRCTFEDFRGYWPEADDAFGISDYLNAVDKVVVSHTLTEPGWRNTTVVRDPLAVVRELRERDGGEIVITGSISVCHALLRAGLVDEIRFYEYPWAQGRGRRLFPADCAPGRLTLLESRLLDGIMPYRSYRIG